MPLSKPVRKQQILLPSSKNFLLLPNDAKEDILKRLTIDNLINYIEFIVGIHQHESDECFKLEQIVEDEIRLNSIASDEDSFISNWIEKNANRVPDLEANLLDHGNVYAMPTTQTITNTLLNSPTSIDQCQSMKEESSSIKVLHDSFNIQNVNQILSPKITDPFQSLSNITSPNLSRTPSSKNGWDNALSYRWQNSPPQSKNDSKENIQPFKAAIERPSPFDLRFNNVDSFLNAESPPIFSKSSGNYSKMNNVGNFDDSVKTNYNGLFMNSENQSPLTEFTDKSDNYPQFGTGSKHFNSNSFLGNDFLLENNSRTNVFRNTLLMTPPNNGFSVYGHRSSQDSIINQKPKQTNMICNRSNNVSIVSKGLEQTFDTCSFSDNSIIIDRINSMHHELKSDPELFKLPDPESFSQMSMESQNELVSSLPGNVKNKYDFYCWSYIFRKLCNERPNGANLFT